jgi:hypothetical protein
MRHKIPDDKKKVKMGAYIDPMLYNILEEDLEKRGIKNLSKYIESLVRADLTKRGENVEKEF